MRNRSRSGEYRQAGFHTGQAPQDRSGSVGMALALEVERIAWPHIGFEHLSHMLDGKFELTNAAPGP